MAFGRCLGRGVRVLFELFWKTFLLLSEGFFVVWGCDGRGWKSDLRGWMRMRMRMRFRWWCGGHGG